LNEGKRRQPKTSTVAPARVVRRPLLGGLRGIANSLTTTFDPVFFGCSNRSWFQTRTWCREVPYFVRRPYSQAEAPQRTESRDDERDILALARDVLAAADRAEPRFRIRDPLRPGEKGFMVLDLTLEKGAPPLRVSLSATDLVAGRARIPSHSIEIVPSSLTVPVGASAEATVAILTPLDARPGLYAGTLSVTGDDHFSVPFEAEVG
jgi:hypothetical protein